MHQEVSEQEMTEILLPRLIAQEREIQEWYSPSIEHLESLAAIFDGCEILKENSKVMDQLFKIFLLIDREKKDKFRTLRHWEVFEKFATELQSSIYFRNTYTASTLKMVDTRICHMRLYIQRCIQALKHGHNLHEALDIKRKKFKEGDIPDTKKKFELIGKKIEKELSTAEFSKINKSKSPINSDYYFSSQESSNSLGKKESSQSSEEELVSYFKQA